MPLDPPLLIKLTTVSHPVAADAALAVICFNAKWVPFRVQFRELVDYKSEN